MNINKKIAVCYSGEVREKNKECRENFKQFVSNKHDTFISTWNEKGGSEKDSETYDISLVSCDEISEIYNPQGVEIQPIFQIPTAFKNNEFDQYFKKKFCQQYHVYKSDLMRRLYEKEHDVKYDLIIKTRPDVYVVEFIDIFKFNDQKLNYNTGYLRGGQPWQCWKNLRYPLESYQKILKCEQINFSKIEHLKTLIGNDLCKYGLDEYSDLIMEDLDMDHRITQSDSLERGQQIGAVHDALSISDSDNSRFYSMPFLFYLKWLALKDRFVNPFIDGEGQRSEINRAYGYHDVMTILSYHLWKYNVHHLEMEKLRFTLSRLVK